MSVLEIGQKQQGKASTSGLQNQIDKNKADIVQLTEDLRLAKNDIDNNRDDNEAEHAQLINTNTEIKKRLDTVEQKTTKISVVNNDTKIVNGSANYTFKSDGLYIGTRKLETRPFIINSRLVRTIYSMASVNEMKYSYQDVNNTTKNAKMYVIEISLNRDTLANIITDWNKLINIYIVLESPTNKIKVDLTPITKGTQETLISAPFGVLLDDTYINGRELERVILDSNIYFVESRI